jgi:hypothetical protein
LTPGIIRDAGFQIISVSRIGFLCPFAQPDDFFTQLRQRLTSDIGCSQQTVIVNRCPSAVEFMFTHIVGTPFEQRDINGAW